MRFSRFRIRNFRSIVDTGWNNLASDNITGIIGQNESGKTSILEALYSFYTGIISDDILRSDLSLPIIYCAFETNVKQFNKILGQKKIPDIITKSIEENGMITIIRRWNNDKSQSFGFGDDKIISYFKNQLNEIKNFEARTGKEILNILEESKKATEEFSQAMQEKTEEQKLLSHLESRLPKVQRAFDRSPGFE